MKLTEAAIARIAPGPSGEVVVRDSQLTGFAVRVRRKADGSLSHSFWVIYQERTHGKRRTIKVTIGQWKDPWTAAAARSEASRLLEARARGERVVNAKKARKASRTIRDLADGFGADHLPSVKPSTAKDYTHLLTNKILPVFSDHKVEEVTRGEIRDWHLSMRKTPYSANRSLAVLSKMFTYSMEREWRADNPATGVKKFPEKKREEWIDEHDLPAFKSALSQRTGPYSEAIRFLAVSGWRLSEALSLRWASVDLKRQIASLDDTKTGAQVRSLSSDAATIIDRQPSRSGYVFHLRSPHAPLCRKNLREELQEVCRSAGIEPITIHGLRHTAATWSAISGANTMELREAFGWRTSAMAERYVERAETLARKGAERAANAINLFDRETCEVREFQKN
ncbi:tyrosine-type recombinase/integrase [Roseibium sediminis]|uniref:tyrosine-type recombinase/integrase n=1 Tax=Roseibium sediminis TaxID=1775174 RepID=UPI00123D1CBB|nr:site-specific integrase [Roseibium sediminis]